jgi:hypothetical protein
VWFRGLEEQIKDLNSFIVQCIELGDVKEIYDIINSEVDPVKHMSGEDASRRVTDSHSPFNSLYKDTV